MDTATSIDISRQLKKIGPGLILRIGPYQKFFKKAVSGSFPLFGAAVLAFLWANFHESSYHALWHTDLSISAGPFDFSKSLIHWIDEALMAIFFFTVGLEIKREVLVGELASFKKAIIPVSAAVGGMLVPALVYAMFNYNTDAAVGWGIPMATDIAFSLAVLAILGSKIPFGLKIFLSAFAIADDLGAVLVIAIFYTGSIDWFYIYFALLFFAGLAVANVLWIRYALVYAILGIGLWFSILGSGVHATVAGVLVAMFIPAKAKYDTRTFIKKIKDYLDEFECDEECGYTILENKLHQNSVHNIELACHQTETPLQRFEYTLHVWVAFLILPLFALANSGISLKGIDLLNAFSHPVTMGILFGLVFGKPAGIMLFTYLAVKLLNVPLIGGISWRHLLGAGMLGGIGFTMSLFISGLSFSSPEFTELSKLGIFSASIVAGFLGLAVLSYDRKAEK